MPQTGYTPIQLYYSSTTTNAPTAGNLVNGELAINIADGKLFYKDNSGVVQVIATKAGSLGDVVGPASATDNAVARYDLTTGKLIQNSGVTIDDSNNVSGVAQLNATTADLTNIEVTNIKAKDGTAAASIADSTGVFTHSTTTVFPAGAVGTPSITTTGDTNTGIFFPAADTIAFAEGGAEAMRIDSSGQVGIGTNSPSVRLDVQQPGVAAKFTATNGNANQVGFSNASNAAAQFYIGSPSADAFQFSNSSGVERMRIDSSGNVGIGVTPSAWTTYKALQVGSFGAFADSATGNIDVSANRYNASGDKYIGTGSATMYRQNTDGNHIWFNAASGTAGNAISFTERMRIDSSGNVGIGTSSPTALLDVYKAGSNDKAVFRNATRTLYVNLDSSGGGIFTGASQAGNSFYLDASGNSAQIYTNSTERMRIDSSGNVGIGTSSPYARFQVATSAVSTTPVAIGIRTEAYSTSNGSQGSYSPAGIAINIGNNNPLNSNALLINFENEDGGGNVCGAYIGTIANNGISNGSSPIVFGQRTGAQTWAERARITSGGRLLVGTTSENTSGGVIQVSNGITFPATQSASSDANTLDDYEEGTWTATLTAATPPTTPPTTTGYYTKIGNLVTVFMRFTNVNTSGGSGLMKITGLPFAARTVTENQSGVPMIYGLSIPNKYVSSYIQGGLTEIGFISPADNGAWSDVNITAGTGKYLNLSMTYQVN